MEQEGVETGSFGVPHFYCSISIQYPMGGWIQQEKGVVWTIYLSYTDFSLSALQDNILMYNTK